MIYTIDLLPKARKELLDSWVWYEEKETGLGNRFEKEIFSKIEKIQSNPLHYPVKKGFHEAIIDDFPFIVIYKVMERSKQILIVSVFHSSRNPRKKLK